MKKRRAIAITVAGLLASSLGLSACGGDDDEGSKDSSGGKAVFDAGSKGIVRPSDKKGGTLRFAVSDDFDSIDCGNTYYGFALTFMRNYCRTLTTYVSKPGQEGTKPAPDLAEELGKATDNNKTWTYKLRKGVKYEDGTEIKAADIKYAVARTFDRGVLRNGPAYFPQILDAKGYKGPYKDKNLDNFKGMETPDDHTVVFKLKDSFAELDQLIMFMGQTSPVPQKKDRGAKYAEHPLATGPYKLDGQYKKGQGGAWVRNENWDASTDPHRKALPDRIEVQAGVEANEVDNRLFNGQADIELAGTGVQDAARKRIQSEPNLKANSDDPLTGQHWYYPINVKTIPNIECRKAIVYATDRDALYRSYGGSLGGEMATSIMPPTIDGREKGQDFYTKAEVGYKGDQNAAKEALKKCGKPSGFSTTMLFRNDRPKEKSAAQAMEQALGQVGIKLKLKGYASGTYTNDQLGSPDFVKQNNVGLATYGWGPDWPTGYGYLQPITDGKAIVEAGNTNSQELNDPEINKMWNDVVRVTDAAKRNEIYNKIDSRARELATMMPTVYAKSLLYRPPNVTNVYFHEGLSRYDYANMGVTK